MPVVTQASQAAQPPEAPEVAEMRVGKHDATASIFSLSTRHCNWFWHGLASQLQTDLIRCSATTDESERHQKAHLQLCVDM